MTLNRIMVTAGITTLLQAAGQLVLTTLAITQYFCVVDFLRGWPILIYMKILYFHNPDPCGGRITIGEAIAGIPNQAFVLLTDVPLPAFRTFVINCIGLGLSLLWIITSVVITMGGAKNKQSKSMRWPWILVTVTVCGLDLVASVTYANDSFQTRTLADIMDFIGGIASGTSNTQLDTSWTAWIMVMLYSRFVVVFIINVILLILVIVSLNLTDDVKTDIAHIEAPSPVAAVPQPAARVQVSTGVQSSPIPTPPPPITSNDLARDEEAASTPSETPRQTPTRIPRAGLSKSFRKMKTFLFRKSASPEVHRRRSNPESSEPSPDMIPRAGLSQSFRRMKTYLFTKSSSPDVHRPRPKPESLEPSPDVSPRTQHVDIDKKRTVNFPASMLSLPQRLENIIAEQQRRLDRAVIDTSARTAPRASQSMPHLAPTPHVDTRGRRGTNAELQGQLPWAYIPASAHRMRDQLPPDEDLPPVPLPDYTAFQSARKASVHRAASSLSSLTQKKDYTNSQSLRSPLQQSDVLY